MKCNECGSKSIRKFGYVWKQMNNIRWNGILIKAERWQLQKLECKECGHKFKDLKNPIKRVVIPQK